MHRLLPLLALCLPGLAWAGIPVELPPGEDPAAWQDALHLGRQLVPELELGPAIGPGPSVRVVEQELGWALDIQTSEGHVPVVELPVPSTPADRLELLLLCADAFTRAPEPEPAADPQGDADAPTWGWAPASLQLGVDLLPGDIRPFALSLEPAALRWRGFGLSPLVAVALPSEIGSGHDLLTARVATQAWWSTGERLQWRTGLGLGLELRELRSDGRSMMRDWTVVPELGSEISLPVAGGWRGLLGVRLGSSLPPTILELGGDEVTLPTWQLQLLAGVRLPWPHS